MWIYPISNDGALISIGTNGSNSSTGGIVWFNATGAGYYATGDKIKQTGLNHPKDNWYHIAFVYNGFVTKIYINGVSLSSTYTYTFSDISWRIKTYIGRNAASSYEFFSGYIDEIRISNTARWTENFTPPIKAYN